MVYFVHIAANSSSLAQTLKKNAFSQKKLKTGKIFTFNLFSSFSIGINFIVEIDHDDTMNYSCNFGFVGILRRDFWLLLVAVGLELADDPLPPADAKWNGLVPCLTAMALSDSSTFLLMAVSRPFRACATFLVAIFFGTTYRAEHA